MTNKEYGSDFHYENEKVWCVANPADSFFYGKNISLFFSGRAALFSILEQGIKNQGWQKVFFPSYYCHKVAPFVDELPIQVEYYEFNPFLDFEKKEINIEDLASNVIVNVDFFGLKKLDVSSFQNAIIIDDLSHHILDLKNSKADYCFGSIRKELPIPMGGFCYSPKKYALPDAKYSNECEALAVQKLSAMFLKKRYVEGVLEAKNLFRALFLEVEHEAEANYTNAKMPNISQSILFQLDVEKILEVKKNNLNFALELLKDCKNIKINLGTKSEAFGLVLECNSLEERNKIRLFLIEKNIFPAILWPDQIYQRDKEIEDKILFLHVDYRYTTEDVKIIITTLKEFFSHEQILDYRS
ncbi:hypothetical protein D3C72_308970 [compost metagenome]